MPADDWNANAPFTFGLTVSFALRSSEANSIIPGMALTALPKKLFRTLARVIPQCGMVSQAVAFNMFLAFFAVLLTALSLMKGSFEGEGGQEVAVRISAILPPGSWQLISAYVLRPRSERLVPGAYRLGRNAARGLAGDEAHHQRHRANLW